MIVERFRYFTKTVDWRQLALSGGNCPLCGPSVFVRLFAQDFGVRCLRCGAAQNTFSLVQTVRAEVPNLEQAKVHLVSAGGPYEKWLARSTGKLYRSQYFDNATPGELVEGTRHEDLQALTYADDSFDLMTSSEVIEHVPDDARAFAEMYRVLKSGGRLVFTVPLSDSVQTVERARLNASGELIHLLEPEYHDDPIRGRILAFRNYGKDVIERLMKAGFSDAHISSPADPSRFGRERKVIVARKA